MTLGANQPEAAAICELQIPTSRASAIILGQLDQVPSEILKLSRAE